MARSYPRAQPGAVGAGRARDRNPRERKTIVLTPQRHQGGIDPSPGGVLFFACPKKRTKRKGSPAAETTPVDGLRNRRGQRPTSWQGSMGARIMPAIPPPSRPDLPRRQHPPPWCVACRSPALRAMVRSSPVLSLPAPPPTRCPENKHHRGHDRSHAPARKRSPGRSCVPFRTRVETILTPLP